jgi:hypothetical protein
MKIYSIYIGIIFIIKIIFILLSLYALILKSKGIVDSSKYNNITYWRDRFEFIFTILMSILLIYLFNPTQTKKVIVEHETLLLLFLFGIILLIKADWGSFFSTSLLFKKVQNII